MKKNLLCLLLFVCSITFAQKNIETQILDENWYFSEVGTDKWLAAKVPGTVHQDLLQHKLLPNPFYGMNEKEIQWVEEKDWEYKTSFTISDEQLKRDEAILSFEGLDTYADVYLNGALLFSADNMFVGYKVPVKDILRPGKNRLHIYFHSPIKKILPQWRSNGFNYPAGNDHRDERLSVFTRKAPYSYGWDWGIRMVTSGVWRPIILSFQNVTSIEDFYVRQLTVSKDEANLSIELELNRLLAQEVEVDVTISWSLAGKNKQQLRKKVQLREEMTSFILPLKIEMPELWMPNGWGDPTLYNFSVEVKSNGVLVAEKQQRIGLRSIRVVKEEDAMGESFYFEVNGVPLFAKGANYIPGDAMLPAMTTERYETLFKDIKAANMNMVRVWGGGTYEDKRFYDLADENGILVWQDFMFACTTYPSDPAFLKRVAEEAEYNIRRLRNHACLAMWCGNNEILEGIKYWGWKKEFEPHVYEGMKQGYDQLFMELLPNKVKEWDAERFYMHGSPHFANWGRPDSWKIADSHNWGVWYGKKPFESLDKEIPRFMSEFGFQAFPEMKTIATFAEPKDYQLESEVMNAHQKSSIGNALIKTYMERDYIVPEKFEDFIYLGLVMQGKGMRQGFEAHRRNRPYCMGTLYWQLNDSWPVVSWSSIDYYGNWKALHYQAQRAFAPILVDAIQQGDSLQIWILSDKLEDMNNMTLELNVFDFQGKMKSRKKIKTSIVANTSAKVWEENLSSLLTSEQMSECYLLLTLKDHSGKKVSEETYFFKKPKELNLPKANLKWKVKTEDGVCELTLSSSQLAKDVFIEIPIQGASFSDNFFDLLPKKSRKITITSPAIKKGQVLDVKIRHLQSIY